MTKVVQETGRHSPHHGIVLAAGGVAIPGRMAKQSRQSRQECRGAAPVGLGVHVGPTAPGGQHLKGRAKHTEQRDGRARLLQGCPPAPVLKGRREQPPKAQQSVLGFDRTDPAKAENGIAQTWLATYVRDHLTKQSRHRTDAKERTEQQQSKAKRTDRLRARGCGRSVPLRPSTNISDQAR